MQDIVLIYMMQNLFFCYGFTKEITNALKKCIGICRHGKMNTTKMCQKRNEWYEEGLDGCRFSERV